MRVFNVRLAAILLGIAVVLCGAIYGLNRFQIHRNASFFKDASERAEKKADDAAKANDSVQEEESMKAAIRYLKWYVGLEPKNTEAAEHLGILLSDRAQAGKAIDRQTFWEAYKSLQKTVLLDPKRKDARRRLVTMAMMARLYSDAQDHLERDLLVDAPNDPDLLEQLGECQAGSRKFDLAAASFKKSIAANDKQVMAYVKLAEVLRSRLSKPKEADEWMAKLVKINPKSSKAHYLRARYLLGSRVKVNDEMLNQALDEACKARELAPDDADVLYMVAMCNVSKRKYDNARDCLAHGIKKHPSNVGMYEALSDIELRSGNREKAIAALKKGIAATDRNPSLLWDLANLLVDTDKPDQARRLLDEVRKTSYPKAKIDYVEARIEFVQSHWKTALQRLNDVRSGMLLEPQLAKIDLMLAHCCRQLGYREQEEQALRRIPETDPAYPFAKKALADIARKKGDYRDAMKELSDSYRNGKLDPVGMLQLAQLRFVNTMQRKPDERNWKPLEDLLDAAQKALPDSPDVPMLRANVLAARGQVADAEKLLLKIRGQFPKNTGPWNGLIAMAVRDKDWEKMEKLLTEAEKALGDTPEQRLLQAQYVVLREGGTPAERLKKLAENVDKFTEEERLQLWKGLLGVALQLGDLDQADSLARKIAAKEPSNAQVRYFLFEKAAAAGDVTATERALKEIEVVAGQDSYWLYGQAILLCLKARGDKDAGPMLEKALDYLESAREKRKDWARIPLVQAGIYDQQGKASLALKFYLDDIELGDRNPVALVRTIEIYFQSQRYAEADRLLTRLLAERRPLPVKLKQAVAECAMHRKDAKRAIEATRNAVPSDSKIPRDLVWRGQMLGVFGRQAKEQGQSAEATDLLDDAENALRRATELEPKLPLVWKALAQFFALMGAQDRAEAVIPEVKANVSAKELPLTLANIYEMVGNTDAAQEQYEALLKAAPQDIAVARVVADFYSRTGKSQPAIALLQRILDGKVPAGEPEVVWARRELAKNLGATHKYPDLQKAIQLVEQNLSGPRASIADRQLLVKLLAFDPQQSARGKAIQVSESLGASATPDDRFLLARLYLLAGDWLKASSLLRGLVASNDREPRYLEYYIDELLKHKEVSSARTYYNQLETLAPNSFATVSRKADLLCASNEQLKAFDLLNDFVNNVDAQPSNRGVRLRLAAEKIALLVEPLTKPEQASVAARGLAMAEALSRDFAKENPDQELVLAAFLGQHGKIDEALRILDGSLQLCEVKDFADTCSLIIQKGKPSKEQLQHMSKIMQSAEAKFERQPALLLALAELRSRQRLYSEAVDIYREILKKAPDDAIAMNNLAVLQALQGVNLDESLKLVNRAMELVGPIGAMRDSRAIVYLAKNDPAKAVEDATTATAEQESADWLFHLAQAHLSAGSNAKAKTAFDAAVKKGLTKDSLHPLEASAFEKLRQLPR